ncbi:MAG: hypothetical protein Q8P71_00475 [bacterium]|nr:hypothetical protein [bacterium]
MKKPIKKGMSAGKKVAIGGAVAAAAAVGAGAYYLLGPNAKAHQKKTLALIAKIKKEVQSEMKKLKEVSTPLYHKAVDAISETYAKQYTAHEKDIRDLAKKLKSEWKDVKKAVKKTVKS